MKKNHSLPPVPERFHQRVQHTLEGLPEQTRPQRRFPLRGVAGVALAAALCVGGTAMAAGVSGGFPPLLPPGGGCRPVGLHRRPGGGGHRRERPLSHDGGGLPL